MYGLVPFKVGKYEGFLNFSISVFFDVEEKYGKINNLLDSFKEKSNEGFESLKWIATKMAEDGELCRRDLGYDKKEFYDGKGISLRMKPLQHMELISAVNNAITKGFTTTESNEDEEVDLGLSEISEKKEIFKSRYNYMALTILKINRKEFYKMNPGMFFDLCYQYNKQHSQEKFEFD